MKKIRRSPVVTGLLFLLAVVLLFAGSVGGTQAALQVFSDDYYSALNLKHIGVTLRENDTDVSWRNYGDTAASGFDQKQDGDLVLNHLGSDPYFRVGKKYDFKITAKNTGSIDQYVRIIVHKYWVKVGDDERFGLKGWFHGLGDHTTKQGFYYDPSLIHLGYNGTDSHNTAWLRDTDTKTSTPEREVYYYTGILSSGSETAPLFDKLWIDRSVAKDPIVTTSTGTDGSTVTSYTYDYDGYGFVVQVEVDAIQTHHARDAIRSGWGLQDDAILSKILASEE